MSKRGRDGGMDEVQDHPKQQRSDINASEQLDTEQLLLQAEGALLSLKAAQIPTATLNDMVSLVPAIYVLSEAAAAQRLTASQICDILMHLSMMNMNAAGVVRASASSQFGEALVKLLGGLKSCRDLWQQHPEAPRHYISCVVGIIAPSVPLLPRDLSEDTTPDTCTAALGLLQGLGDPLCPYIKTRPVVDALMEVLRTGSAGVEDAASSILVTMTRDIDVDFLDQLLQWGFVQRLAERIVAGSHHNISKHALFALGNCCLRKLPTPYLHPMQTALGTLVPVLVSMVMAREDMWAHLWLLNSLCKLMPACANDALQAGAIPAALLYMNTCAQCCSGMDRGLDEAAQLLACLSSRRTSSMPLSGCCAIEILVRALDTAPLRRFSHIVVVLFHMLEVGLTAARTRTIENNYRETSPSTSYEVAAARLSCLKEGLMCHVERRLQQLDPTLLEASTRQHVQRLAAAVKTLMDPTQFSVGVLASFSLGDKVAAACYLVEHAPEKDLRSMLLDWGMLRVLCKSLVDCSTCQCGVWYTWRYAAWALHALGARLLGLKDAAAVADPQSAGPEYLRVAVWDGMLLGEHRWTDVKVVVEGRAFFVLREVLLQASPVFRAMLEGGFSEQQAPEITLQGVTRDVWQVLLRHMYTGRADIPPQLVQEVLAVAEQYLLDGLKHTCQEALIRELSLSNAPQLFALSQQFSAQLLQRRCMVLMLKHWAAGADFTPAEDAARTADGHSPMEPLGSGSLAGPSQQADHAQNTESIAETAAGADQMEVVEPADGVVLVDGESQAATARDGGADNMQVVKPARAETTSLASVVGGSQGSPSHGLADHQTLPEAGVADEHRTTSGKAAEPRALDGEDNGEETRDDRPESSVSDIEQREASVDAEFREKVAAALLPCLLQLLEEVLPAQVAPCEQASKQASEQVKASV